MSGRKTWWSVLKKDKTDEEKEKEFEEYEADLEEQGISDPEDLLEGKKKEKAEFTSIEDAFLDQFQTITSNELEQLQSRKKKLEEEISELDPTQGDEIQERRMEMYDIDNRIDAMAKQATRIVGGRQNLSKERSQIYGDSPVLSNEPDDQEIKVLESIQDSLKSGYDSLSSEMRTFIEGAFLLKAGEISNVLDKDKGMRYNWRDPQAQLRRYLWRRHKLFKWDVDRNKNMVWLPRPGLDAPERQEQLERLREEEKQARIILKKFARDLPPGLGERHILDQMARIMPMFVMDPELAEALGSHLDEFDEVDRFDELDRLRAQRREQRGNPQNLAAVEAEIERLQTSFEEEGERRFSKVNQGALRGRLMAAMTQAMDYLEATVIQPARSYQIHRQKNKDERLFRQILDEGNLPNTKGIAQMGDEDNRIGVSHGFASYPPQIFDLSYWGKGNYFDADELLETDGERLLDFKRDLGLTDSFDKSHFVQAIREILSQNQDLIDDEGRPAPQDSRKKQLQDLLDSVVTRERGGVMGQGGEEMAFNRILMNNLVSSWNGRHGGGCSCGMCGEGSPSELLASRRTGFSLHHPNYDQGHIESRGMRQTIDAIEMSHREEMNRLKYAQKDRRNRLAELRALQRDPNLSSGEAMALYQEIEQLGQELDPQFSLADYSEAFDLDDAEHVYHSFTLPKSEELQDTKEKLYATMNLISRKEMGSARQQRALVRMPYGDFEKRMQATFSEQEGDTLPDWRKKQTSSHDYTDRIEYLKYAQSVLLNLFDVEEDGKVSGQVTEDHWKELGASDKMAKWCSTETDLYKRLMMMYEALLDCTPEYDYKLKSNWSHDDKAGLLMRRPGGGLAPATGMQAMTSMFDTPFDYFLPGMRTDSPTLKPGMLDDDGRISTNLISDIFAPGVSQEATILGKYPGVTTTKTPTGWKYGKKMKALAKKFDMEPDDLRMLLQDESDGGIYEQHVTLATLVDELGHMTRDEPTVSGEERTSQFEMDERTSPVKPKTTRWARDLLNEAEQTAMARNDDGTVRMTMSEPRYDPKEGKTVQREVPALRVIGGRGPVYQEKVEPKKTIFDAKRVVDARSGNRKRRSRERYDFDTGKWVDEFGRTLGETPHLGEDGPVMTPNVILEVLRNTNAYTNTLDLRMRNLYGTPVANSVGHVQPYEMFPIANVLFSKGLPHHIDADDTMTPEAKEQIKTYMNQVLTGALPDWITLPLINGVQNAEGNIGPDGETLARWLSPDFLNQPTAYEEIVKYAWDMLSRVDGKGLGFDPFELNDNGDPIYTTHAFQFNDALSQLFDSISYDVLDCLVNPKTRLERMRKMFGVELSPDGELMYTTNNQGPNNVTGGKTRCSGPIGLSCAGDGHISYDAMRQYLIYEGGISPEGANDENEEMRAIEKALDDGTIRHYGDSEEGWKEQARREARFSGTPSDNVGVKNLRYSCPYCDSKGVCNSCDGDSISLLPEGMEDSFQHMIIPVIERHMQNEAARIAAMYPGTNPTPRLGQSMISFIEENKLDELLDEDTDLEKLRAEKLREDRKGLLGDRTPPSNLATGDPYRHVRTARAARASASEAKYEKSIKDDVNRSAYMESSDDRLRTRDEYVLRQMIEGLEHTHKMGKTLPLNRYFSRKDWGWDIYPKHMQDEILAEGDRRGLTEEETKKRYLDSVKKDMDEYAEKLEALNLPSWNEDPDALKGYLSQFRKAYDLLTGGKMDSLSEWQARMQHRVSQRGWRRQTSAAKEDYSQSQRFAAQQNTLKGGRRWKTLDSSPYQWISGIAGYLTPPWDDDTANALKQAERVYKLTALMEELRSYAMHHPSNAGKVGEWKKATRLANTQTNQAIEKLQSELAELRDDGWFEEHALPEENWWQTQLRRDFMIESAKERIALMKDIIAMREDDAETEAYQELLSSPSHAHMTDEKAWELAKGSLMSTLKPILMHTSSLGDEGYLLSERLSGEFDLDFPDDLEGFAEKLSDMLTSETSDMNSQFKGSPFDYQSEIRQMVEASEQAQMILNDPNSSPEEREQAARIKEDCRYSVLKVKGPHSVVNEDDINPITGKPYADEIYFDDEWVVPRLGNQSVMEMAADRFSEKTGIENPLASKEQQQKLDRLLNRQEILSVLRDRLEQFLDPVHAIADKLGMSTQDVALLSQRGLEEQGYGPDWLYKQLSELDSIPQRTRDEYGNIVTEDVPWDADSLFDVLESEPLAHRIKEMEYSEAWHKEHADLEEKISKAIKEKGSTSQEVTDLQSAYNALFDRPKDTIRSSGYAYHPLFSVNSYGNKLMDNHNYAWDDPESGKRSLEYQGESDDTFYELRAEPMSLTSQPEEEGDNTFRNPYFTISLALAATRGTQTGAQIPSRVMGAEEGEGETVVEWTPHPGGMINHHQKNISSGLQRHFEEMVQWDPTKLLRMYHTGDIDLTEEQIRGLQDRIALFHHGINLSEADLSDRDWFMAPPNFSELDMLEMSREQASLDQERRRLNKAYNSAKKSGDEEQLQQIQTDLESNANSTRELHRQVRLPEGMTYKTETVRDPSFTSASDLMSPRVGDTPSREGELQAVIDGKATRGNEFDPDAPAVNPDWPGLSPWAEEKLTGEPVDPRLSETQRQGGRNVATRAARDAMDERDASGADMAAQQLAARRRGAFVPTGTPTARLLQEQEREKLGETDEKPDTTAYAALPPAAFIRPSEQPPEKPSESDDEVSTSSDNPIDFAFRILKNLA